MPLRFLDIAGIFIASFCETLKSRHIEEPDIFLLRFLCVLGKKTRAEVYKNLAENEAELKGNQETTNIPRFQISWKGKKLRKCDVHWVVLRCASTFRVHSKFTNAVSPLQVKLVITRAMMSLYDEYTIGSTKRKTIRYVLKRTVRGLKSVCSKIQLKVGRKGKRVFNRKAILTAIRFCVLFRKVADKILENLNGETLNDVS